VFIGSSETSALINRSGDAFHVSLFAGPVLRPHSWDQFVCTFAYVDDQIGPERKLLIVYLLPAICDPEEMLGEIESAADGIAQLLDEGRPLELAYTFRGNLLIPGTPK